VCHSGSGVNSRRNLRRFQLTGGRSPSFP
jgi:hypothetical protein